jgi:hypothetical protein
MRLPTHLRTFYCIVLAALSFSCQKEMKLNRDAEAKNSITNTATNCKPVGLGLLVNVPNEPQLWFNLMLKWYGSNGKLSHIKAFIEEALPSNLFNPAFNLDYGEVLYDNDMIYLRDVLVDKIILKVKLDASGRPIASWFDGLYHNIPMTDTTHLYYTAAGVLDSITRSYRIGTLPHQIPLNTTYRCEYDHLGNIIHLNEPSGRVNFKYDYTRTNPGLVPHYVVSIPLKLLEYLELLQFPHYNLLTTANSGALIPGQGYPDDTFIVHLWNFFSPRNNSTGQIYYYEDRSYFLTSDNFYSAWDCNNNNLIQSKNPTQGEFMKMVR